MNQIDALLTATLAPGAARSGAAAGASAAAKAASGSGAQEVAGTAFADLLQGAVQQASDDQWKAEKTAREFVEGKGDVMDAMLATSHADVSLRFVVTLRNRILDAYQEIMRLQV